MALSFLYAGIYFQELTFCRALISRLFPLQLNMSTYAVSPLGDIWCAPAFVDTLQLHIRCLLEFNRRQHPIVSMATTWVEEHLVIIEHVLPGIGLGSVSLPSDPLCFEKMKEALRHSIVPESSSGQAPQLPLRLMLGTRSWASRKDRHS